MKKLIIAAVMFAGATPALAVTSYLAAEWYANGSHFCRYDNGTVLNVGYRVCPLKIEG